MTQLLAIDETPSSFAAGVWPESIMNGAGTWRFVWIPGAASGTPYDGFQAMFVGPVIASQSGGLWIDESAFEIYDIDDNLAGRAPATWDANQPIRLTIRGVEQTLTIEGATTGNATVPIGPGPYFFAGTTLTAGSVTGQSGFELNGTLQDIDDGVDVLVVELDGVGLEVAAGEVAITNTIALDGVSLAIAVAPVTAQPIQNLPPLPIEVAIPRPLRRPHEATKYPNPRAIPPNLDGALHRNRRPECSLVESMAPIVDEMRQMAVDAGLRYYEVFTVVVRWSGGERHRGTPTVLSEQPFLPIPEVSGTSGVDRELRAGGSVRRGGIWLRKLSPRYTIDDILLLFPRELRPDEEHFIEVRGDARDGANTPRDRYVIAGRPERKAWGWEVRLIKADEDRTRQGGVR